MLILSRKPGESILVEPDIVIKYLDTRPDGRIRLGFTAPRGVAIYRAEVAERIAAEKAEKREGKP